MSDPRLDDLRAQQAQIRVDAVGRLFFAAIDKRDGLRSDTSAEVDAVVSVFTAVEPAKDGET